jgi:L-arabinose isomerase
MDQKLKIGLFGIGLEAYWPQFPGLHERLTHYLTVVADKFSNYDAEIFNVGLIDNVDRAYAAGTAFRKADVDILFLYVTTYALSSTVLPVVRKANVPIIILNLTPKQSIDYEWFNSLNDRNQMTGEWLAYCSACALPEISNLFSRAGIPFFQVTGILDDEDVWEEVEEWISAAKVARIMYNNRLGLMGNYYGGMLDIYSDLTLQCSVFGGHIEIIEVDELSSIKQTVTEQEMKEKIADFEHQFEIEPECSEPELRRAAYTAVALDKLVKKYQLGSIAYYHKGAGNPQNEETMSSVILGCSLLTASGVPVAGEYEVKNAQAMKIMDSFGVGGSFSEFYGIDYTDDIVLLGHDGPGHLKVAQGRIKVSPLRIYHGKIGHGLSVEMSVKNGPVTLLSVIETRDGRLKFLTAEAVSIPGAILKIGNTNSRYKFAISAKQFVEDWNSYGPAHHCAIGIGHIASKIKKLSQLLCVPYVQVC